MKIKSLVLLSCAFCTMLPSATFGQIIPKDRVLAGNNLATASKLTSQPNMGVKDTELRRSMLSQTLNVIVIQARKIKGKMKYFVLMNKGKSTKFDEVSISVSDYNWLIKQANDFEI